MTDPRTPELAGVSGFRAVDDAAADGSFRPAAGAALPPPIGVQRAFLLELLGHCDRMAKLAGTDSSYQRGKTVERVKIKAIIRDESLAAAALIRKELDACVS